MTEQERALQRLEAQALSSRIKRYLVLVEKSSRQALEAISEAEECSLEAGKPVIEVGPANLSIAAGASRPSINQRLSERAKRSLDRYHESVRDLQAAMDKLTTELEPPGD